MKLKFTDPTAVYTEHWDKKSGFYLNEIVTLDYPNFEKATKFKIISWKEVEPDNIFGYKSDMVQVQLSPIVD